jgi:PAS domain S-box-containing protein
MVDEWPDARRFAETIEPLVAEGVARNVRVVAFGEMVNLLCERRRHAAAIELEELWNKLAAVYPFMLCCGYATHAVDDGPDGMVQHVCDAHAFAVPTERYGTLASERERLTYICELERRARSLEQEVEHRKATERLLAARERELAEFLEGAPQAMHAVGSDGVIRWANRFELQMLGYALDEYVGRPIADFYVDQQTAQSVLRRLAAGEILSDVPVRMRRKDGSIADVLVTSNVRWEGGGFLHTRCFSRDVTGQVRAERALAESEAREAQTRALLATIVSCSDDAIISKSLDGRITSWNEGATRLYGYSADEAIGKPILLVVPFEQEGEERDILERLGRGERIDHFETVRLAKDGRRIDVSLTISPIRDAQGKVVGASKVARDITERKRIEANLRTADRRKDEFIAMLGHELRNPLAPIRTVAEVLRRTVGANAQCVQLCDIVERQVQQMTRLLDDLLDVNRITRGKIKFHRERVEVHAVIQRALEASRPLVEQRGQRLAVDVARDAGHVQGDFERLVQLVTNLLNNAAKYTPERGAIDLRVARRDDAIEIHVKDDGAGIAADVLPHVFDLFVQDESLHGAHDGLGIGLTLVRIIAEHHGGSVIARSDGKGQGSEFVVTLPAAAPGVEAKAVRAPHPMHVPRKRIVIADDNPDALASLAMLLRLSGHDVTVASDAASALSSVAQVQPDLALLDIGLPGMDGYEVARRLRQGGCTVPLAAVTGYGTPEDRERSREAGFDHHIVKPIDPATLERLLASA